jgi:hypothetical protein
MIHSVLICMRAVGYAELVVMRVAFILIGCSTLIDGFILTDCSTLIDDFILIGCFILTGCLILIGGFSL